MLHGAYGVRVRNCIIEGFDFGVEVVNAKLPPALWARPQLVALLQNRLVANTITARFAIQVVGADNTLIQGNTLTYGHGAGGAGVQLWADSDGNTVRNNVIVGESINDDTRFNRWPGWNPAARRPDAVLGLIGTQIQSVFNVIVNGQLQQVLVDHFARQDNTVVEGNYIDTGSTTGYGVVFDESRYPRVEGNEIHGGLQGVHFSGTTLTQPYTLPGRCTQDPDRSADRAAGCFIPGYDKTDWGPWIPGPSVTVNAGVDYGQIIGNRILGPFTSPPPLESLDNIAAGPDAVYMGVNPLYPLIVGNEIAGAARAGVLLRTFALETAVVSRNVIHDNAYGIVMLRTNPPFVEQSFGATITLNDVIASSRRAVGNSSFYDRPSEVSDPATLRGNYWGRTCDDSHGFRPFDPQDPDSGDSLRPHILDSHAYGEPVAATPDPKLPPTCR